jgi:hypothetical protein
MSRKVFFSFHFKRDAWRAGQIRNCDLLADEDEYGVVDSVDWEKLEKEGDAAIERWINDQLKYTSVTVVLIGAETSERDWIDYEIRRSWQRGNALLGLRIHKVKDQHGKTDARGANPLDQVHLIDGKPLSSLTRTYDWVDDDGRNNLGSWVEDAFQARAEYDGEEQLQEPEAVKAASQSSRVPLTERSVGPTIIANPPAPWSP